MVWFLKTNYVKRQVSLLKEFLGTFLDLLATKLFFWQIELIKNLKLDSDVVIETIRKHGQRCCRTDL